MEKKAAEIYGVILIEVNGYTPKEVEKIINDKEYECDTV